MTKVCVWIVTSAVFAVPAAKAVIVVDHSMNRTGWATSDTALVVSGGELLSAQAADDFQLAASATIRHVAWWGLYEHDVLPAVDTMRIRFYDARPGDGLPGNVLFEENLLNPSRTATGVIVQFIPPGTTGTAAEYQFESDLPTAVSLAAGTLYWLEIVQDGDPSTTFDWRRALAEQNGIALLNSNLADWQRSTLTSDSAFQLSTIPEPGTVALLALGISLARRANWST